MFSGIGGFELGIQKALSKSAWRNTDDGDSSDARGESEFQAIPVCVGYSEIDKHAIKTYEGHYDNRNYGDITTIKPAGLPDFDLVVGGFPCQTFSVAGKRRGFQETRGTLFFDVARIVAHKRPGHLVLENVKGLLSHDDGKTFQTILRVLAELGYDVEWQLLNSKDWGVPQNRERIYIIGHLRGQCSAKVLPITRNYHADYGTGSEAPGDTAQTITAQGQRNHRGTHILAALTETRTDEAKAIRREHQKQGKDWSPRRGKILAPRTDGQANTITTGLTREHLVAAGIADRTRPGGVRWEIRSDSLANTLRTAGGGASTPLGHVDGAIRKLTPIECERLQGFPDDWTMGSDSQRYKQCGNAVTVNVVQAVISSMEKCLT